ncbi:hypothetical protein [Flavobacterium crassostreae]|uniref:Cell wall anchor protein n=1 Tax=Flavobacterium crassostreae TaxID=1763534 RepID=A0A1B9E4N3_9FLAO|nr:hypothetical protein [Flavobacterium crassostreae]OCB76906.1 hypothetical protein LPBF_05695 [Flavobacterium crassostreae]
MKKITFLLLFFLNVAFAQVGIGTVTPDPSAVLELSSTTQGLLTPRMTTTQRTAIASPANGLMVYDTTLKTFYYYDSAITSWVNMNAVTSYGRLKFKRIKSTDVLATVLAAEKTAGGGSKYLLDSQTLYEVNGTINVDFPIELNNAYMVGLNSTEDKLIKATGDLFVGTTGGVVKVLTLTATAGSVFNIVASASQSFIFRDTVVAGSASVGKLEGFGLVFISIVQLAANSAGIVYKDISKLLISNMGWFGNNSGTYETFQGTFGLVQKTGGFSEVIGAKIGVDVSSNPTITGDAVMGEVVFTGTLTSGKYVNGYTVGSFSGYNFNNKWSVNCAGIPREEDGVATGDMNFDYAVGSGAGTTFNTSNPSNTLKLVGVSVSNSLFRFSRDAQDNRLKYLGLKKRFFQITGSVSFQVSNPGTYIIYIAKNGTPISQYKIYGRGLIASDIVVLPLIASAELANSDYIEVYVQRYTSNSTSDYIVTPNLNIVVN